MAESRDEPIVVGGTGGSGTRVLVQILRALDVYMGSEFNPALDSIPMGRFDWRWGRRLIMQATDPQHPGFPDRAVRSFRRASARQLKDYPGDRWGWKHPHSYLLLPFLHSVYPRLRFIHLVRNGLDMAISANTRQVERYGDLFVAPVERVDGEAVTAATFWSRANLLARRTGREHLGDRYVCIRFEDLCEQPLATITDLASRFEIAATADHLARAAELPQRPATAGRSQNLALELRKAMSDPARAALIEFGYEKWDSLR